MMLVNYLSMNQILTRIPWPMMYFKASVNMEVIINLSFSNNTTSPLSAATFSSVFFPTTEGIITKIVKGIISTNGSNMPITT